MFPNKILVIGIICFLAGGCSDGPHLPPLASHDVILAFGDSLTNGTGARAEESYPAVLEQLSGRKVINEGIPGEISEEGLSRLPGLLEEYNPRLVILCHGGNDMLRQMDLHRMEANLRGMIRLAQDQNIPVVLLGVPKPGLFLSSADIYKTIAASTGVVFIEDLVPEVLGDRALKSDTIHPNKEGYRVIADNIYEVLQEAGAL
ncbi:MAG: arylesterase [Gammaproteobacteria bacterium]